MSAPSDPLVGPDDQFAETFASRRRCVRARMTTKALGDFSIDAPEAELAARRRSVVDLPWVWLRQVHGGRVVVVDRASLDETVGSEADAVVTVERGLVLAIHTADCVPVMLSSDEGVIGAVHAGWRSIEAGIIQSAVAAMREIGATTIHSWIGPHIGPECYQFGEADIVRLETSLGAPAAGIPGSLRGVTGDGDLALDLTRAVQLALAPSAVQPGSSHAVATGCTACDADRWFSHRARGEAGRMATVVWIEP